MGAIVNANMLNKIKTLSDNVKQMLRYTFIRDGHKNLVTFENAKQYSTFQHCYGEN